MKKWKALQEAYHRLNPETPDMVDPDDIALMCETDPMSIVAMVSRYMQGYVPEKIVYPAKSYFVALVYARLLRDHFGEDPVEMLGDIDLLHGNDPYYETIHTGHDIYMAVINAFGWDFDLTLGEIPDVQKYFMDEFMLSSNS
jgi:hypothetical protein